MKTKTILAIVISFYPFFLTGCKNDGLKEVSVADNPQALIKDKNITLKRVK